MRWLSRGLAAVVLIGGVGLVVGPAGLASAAEVAAGQPSQAGPPNSDAVFVQTDNPAGNQIVVLAEHRDGRLSQAAVVATGGKGAIAAGSAADHLASQSSLLYVRDRGLLFVVNAGSGTLSVLSVQGRQLQLDQVVSSGGQFPNSIAVWGNLLYVVNSGGNVAVSGFWIHGDRLTPIPNSSRALGISNANPPFFLDAPGQVAFSPNGHDLIVSTKDASNSIDVFTVGSDGSLSASPSVVADGTNIPFSFATGPDGELLVAEAASNSLHPYSFEPSGTLTSVSASVGDGQSALCWVTAAAGFYFTGNAGSNDVSSYTVNGQGVPQLLGTGVAGSTDAGAIDLVGSLNGKYLYEEAGVAGAVDEFQINPDGSLTSLGSVADLGPGIEGIATD